MSATTATNTSLRPAIPKRTGQRGRHVARKRAVAFDGSLQVDDTSKGQLQTSPSFSPAYLLAALEWAEDSENRNIDRPSNKPSRVPGRSGERKPLVPSSAHKTASNLKLRPGRRNDDVKKLAKIRPRPSEPSEPSTPRIDLLPEKLVFRSRQTPVSFLPPPSSVSPDAASKSAFFNNKLPSSPISPGSPLQNRKQHHRYQQQRPGTSNEVGQPPWYNGPKKASFSADNVAQVANETNRIILARPPPPPGGKRSDGKPAVYQTMQPSTVPPPSMTKSSSPPRQPQGPVREAFAFFSRGRKKSHASDSPRSTLTKRSRALPVSSTSTSAETQETQFDSTHSPQSPGIDSIPDMARFPAEGENPTGKSVVVRCKGTTVTVLVTKETSAADLLVSCSRSLADLGRPITLDTSVVIEPCVRPGLERRLRQYELVWDVISAWDNDSSNFLTVLSDTSDPDWELSLSSVPKSLDEPEGFVLPLYFLQRPGKWAQRFITLKENGQVFASKKQDFKPSDKNVARLCHLSDFDLYLPTEAEMRKQLRPPKRYCYAIRSQQKATLFIDSTHYCHFFCTEDPIVARQFRSAVQGWRSWYLVHKKLGLHEKKEVSSPVSLSKGDHGYRSRASTDQGSRGRPSMDQGPRGRPSIDQAPLIQSVPSSRDDVSPDASAGGSIPPVPPLPASLQGKKAEVFTATGLLGNGYDERRQQVLRREASTRHRRGTVTTSPDDDPFIDGPSLLNNHAAATPTSDARPQTGGSGGSPASPSRRPDRAGWFPSAVQHSAEQQSTRPLVSLSRRPSTSSHGPSRSRSVRRAGEPRGEEHQPPLPTQKLPPQPLIDLTPTFVEPPQWNREGRGRGVRAPQGKPLVDLATGHVLPPSTAARFRDAAPPKNLLRRPDTAAPSATSGGSGGGGGGGGGTLMDQYDLKKSASQRGRPRAPTLGDGADPIQGGLLGDLARRNTVRSNASAGGGGGGGSRPSVPSPAAAAAYMQSRGKTMRVGDAERDKLRERLRNVDGRGGGGMAVRERRS